RIYLARGYNLRAKVFGNHLRTKGGEYMKTLMFILVIAYYITIVIKSITTIVKSITRLLDSISRLKESLHKLRNRPDGNQDDFNE
ncbi:hypothetical protein OCR85_008590, partial [Clostridioides difficile]|nr:hypothetical protein [Clostridioides difficile]